MRAIGVSLILSGCAVSSHVVTFAPVSPWTIQQTLTSRYGTFSIYTASGSDKSNCFRVDPSDPPFDGYSMLGYDKGQCAPLTRWRARLITLSAADARYHPYYGLYAAAVARNVASVTLNTRTPVYDPKLADYDQASFKVAPVGGIALITFPADNTLLSLSITTSDRRTVQCASSVNDPFLPAC